MGEQDNQNRNPLEGWTSEDRYNLFIALKNYPIHRIKAINTFIPTKTPEEITAAISYFKDKTKKQRTMLRNIDIAKKTKLRPDLRVPLANWASLLTDTFSFEDLQTDTSTAVRLIADVEKVPPPFETEDVDFRKVYHQIANAMEGKGIIGNKYINAILKKCIVDTAFTSKSFIKSSTFKIILSSVNLAQSESRTGFPSHTDDIDLIFLRQIARTRSYNPLNIPENYFKPEKPTTTLTLDY
ncbi:hypothetical protein K1T71_004548 [Dendrolimus kikuchii]|uniref:Uncharacterized protein n=1 Tax=Dendrolimus kikuchii TaxID=765133 RepID=A0ACC1D7W9_9NEOP|nr:hypothetical protein K1T71_004548 [Dendrolimus kikuchii]